MIISCIDVVILMNECAFAQGYPIIGLNLQAHLHTLRTFHASSRNTHTGLIPIFLSKAHVTKSEICACDSNTIFLFSFYQEPRPERPEQHNSPVCCAECPKFKFYVSFVKLVTHFDHFSSTIALTTNVFIDIHTAEAILRYCLLVNVLSLANMSLTLLFSYTSQERIYSVNLQNVLVVAKYTLPTLFSVEPYSSRIHYSLHRMLSCFHKIHPIFLCKLNRVCRNIYMYVFCVIMGRNQY